MRLEHERAEILAIVGRDVKTPLGTLLAYTQSLLRNLCGPITTEQRSVVLRLERTLHRVILSTLDLLDYRRARSRGLGGPVLPFSLAGVLDHLLSRHMAAIELGAYRIHKMIPEELPPCLGDEIRTDRSISNLVRAMLERLPPSSEIRIEASSDDKTVRCDISAAPSDLAPFLDGLGREARSPEIGEALGLRITRAGIESQGGRVELLQSAEELTVRLSLPRHRAT
jgi:signal transduction histidine kinase